MKPLRPDRESALPSCCTDEVWAAHPSFPEEHEVSSCGRVWSIPRYSTCQRRVGGKLLKVSHIQGIWRVSTVAARRTSEGRNVGVLVLSLFSGEAADGRLAYTVDVGRGPHLDNLCWLTKSEITDVALQRGSITTGDGRFNTQVSDATVAHIRRMLADGLSQPEIANIVGLNPKYISRISTASRRTRPAVSRPGVSITDTP